MRYDDPRGNYGPAECPVCGSVGVRAWMLDHIESEHPGMLVPASSIHDPQTLATALRDLSTSAALFEQNQSTRNRRRLNHVSDYVERVLDEFVASEGDVRPRYLPHAIPFSILYDS